MSSADRRRPRWAALLLAGAALSSGAPRLAAQAPAPNVRLELRLSGGQPCVHLQVEAGFGANGYGLRWAVDLGASRGVRVAPSTRSRALFLARVWAGDLSLRGIDRPTVAAVLQRLRGRDRHRDEI